MCGDRHRKDIITNSMLWHHMTRAPHAHCRPQVPLTPEGLVDYSQAIGVCYGAMLDLLRDAVVRVGTVPPRSNRILYYIDVLQRHAGPPA